jgi:hypothetical protein
MSARLFDLFEETLEDTFLLRNHVVETLDVTDLLALAKSSLLLRPAQLVYPLVIPTPDEDDEGSFKRIRRQYDELLFLAMASISSTTTVEQWEVIRTKNFVSEEAAGILGGREDYSLLMAAVEVRNPVLAKYFAEKYPHTINDPNGSRGPIHLSNLTPEIAKILLAHGANPDLMYYQFCEKTALDGVDLKKVELVRVLFEAKASVTSQERRLKVQKALKLVS